MYDILNGLRAGMSAAPLMAAARVAAGVTSLTCHDRTFRTGRNLISSRSTSGLGFYWETITSIGSRIKRRFLIRSLGRSNGLGIRPRAGLRDRAAEMDEARSPVLFLRSCKRTSAPSLSAKARTIARPRPLPSGPPRRGMR